MQRKGTAILLAAMFVLVFVLYFPVVQKTDKIPPGLGTPVSITATPTPTPWLAPPPQFPTRPPVP